MDGKKKKKKKTHTQTTGKQTQIHLGCRKVKWDVRAATGKSISTLSHKYT